MHVCVNSREGKQDNSLLNIPLNIGKYVKTFSLKLHTVYYPYKLKYETDLILPQESLS